MSASPPALTLRERQKRETHELIARAAERLFAERGFVAVTVDDVASAAGVSRQTVFNHFPTKEDLVFDRSKEAEALMISAMRDRPPGMTSVGAFREMTHEFWSRMLGLPDPRPPGGFFDLVEASPALQAYARELSARAAMRVAEVIAQQTAAIGDDLRPQVAARALTSVYDAVFLATQRHITAGRHPRRFLPGVLAQADRAYAMLDASLGPYLDDSTHANR